MDRIKELRKKTNMTMKQLSIKIGVAESTVSLYENGKRQPDYEILKKIADIFNVSIDYLLYRTDYPSMLHQLAEEKYYLDKFKNLDIKTQQQLLDCALSEQEQYLVNCFRSMSDQGKEYIIQTINMAKETYRITEQNDMESGYRIAAFGAKETEADDQPPIDENIL